MLIFITTVSVITTAANTAGSKHFCGLLDPGREQDKQSRFCKQWGSDSGLCTCQTRASPLTDIPSHPLNIPCFPFSLTSNSQLWLHVQYPRESLKDAKGQTLASVWFNSFEWDPRAGVFLKFLHEPMVHQSRERLLQWHIYPGKYSNSLCAVRKFRVLEEAVFSLREE